MVKNISLLTKLSVKNFFADMDIYNKEKKKFNKKSIYFWLILIIIIAMFCVSDMVLNSLQEIGQTENFLNIFFTLIFIVLSFQSILICTNMFYFSKDIEDLLSFPIKPIELLMSKFNTILSMLYGTELLFMLIPMLLYGGSIGVGIDFYIKVLVVMFVLPIFPLLMVGILNLLLINFIKVIKNKNLFQVFTTTILIIFVIIAESVFIKNIIVNGQEMSETLISLDVITNVINKSTLIINPLIDFLNNKDILLNFIKIIVLILIPFLIFIFIGSRYYIKQVLKITYYKKNKQNKNIDIEKNIKICNIKMAYVKNEFNLIFRNMAFFIQYVFPVCMLLVSIVFIANYYKINLIDKNNEISEFLNSLSLDIEGYCWILGICQVFFSLTSISLTAISRQGKNAIFMKYIPVDLHLQFWLKSIPQNVINIIISIVLINIIKYIVPNISTVYLIIAFINLIFLSIINSNLMLIVDLKRPILNWKSEYEVIKQNNNKVFQYVLTIGIVWILMYFIKIFKGMELILSVLIITLVLIVIILIIDKYVNKKIKGGKLFNKIV